MPDTFLLELTREALAELDRPDGLVAAVMRKAIRLARLRHDWEAVYWLSMDLEPIGDKEARSRRIAEVAPHFSQDELRKLHDRSLEATIACRTVGYIDERGEIDEDKMTRFSVPELEAAIVTLSTIRLGLQGQILRSANATRLCVAQDLTLGSGTAEDLIVASVSHALDSAMQFA